MVVVVVGAVAAYGSNRRDQDDYWIKEKVEKEVGKEEEKTHQNDKSARRRHPSTLTLPGQRGRLSPLLLLEDNAESLWQFLQRRRRRPAKTGCEASRTTRVRARVRLPSCWLWDEPGGGTAYGSWSSRSSRSSSVDGGGGGSNSIVVSISTSTGTSTDTDTSDGDGDGDGNGRMQIIQENGIVVACSGGCSPRSRKACLSPPQPAPPAVLSLSSLGPFLLFRRLLLVCRRASMNMIPHPSSIVGAVASPLSPLQSTTARVCSPWKDSSCRRRVGRAIGIASIHRPPSIIHHPSFCSTNRKLVVARSSCSLPPPLRRATGRSELVRDKGSYGLWRWRWPCLFSRFLLLSVSSQ